jgi:hypothetical protein
MAAGTFHQEIEMPSPKIALCPVQQKRRLAQATKAQLHAERLPRTADPAATHRDLKGIDGARVELKRIFHAAGQNKQVSFTQLMKLTAKDGIGREFEPLIEHIYRAARHSGTARGRTKNGNDPRTAPVRGLSEIDAAIDRLVAKAQGLGGERGAKAKQQSSDVGAVRQLWKLAAQINGRPSEPNARSMGHAWKALPAADGFVPSEPPVAPRPPAVITPAGPLPSMDLGSLS